MRGGPVASPSSSSTLRSGPSSGRISTSIVCSSGTSSSIPVRDPGSSCTVAS